MALSETLNGGCEGEAEDSVVKASLLGCFSENGEIRALISRLPEVHGDRKISEPVTERFLGKRVIHTYETMTKVDGNS